MSDMTKQFPSNFDLWEFVSSFEDGTLPTAAWNERALEAVAVWYLFLLPTSEAMLRLEAGLRSNYVRFASRPAPFGNAMPTVDEVWPRVLRQALEAFGGSDPVAIANRLMQPRIAEVRDRAA